MLQVAKQSCQIIRKSDNHIMTVSKGDVVDFEGGHLHLQPLSGPTAKKVDFLQAGEAELLESKWTFKEAAKAIADLYKIRLKKSDKKSEVVTQILDARYRGLDVDPNKRV